MTLQRLLLRVSAAAILAGAAMAVGGCGVRGPLEAPPEAKVTGTNSTAETPTDPGKDSAAKSKPHKDFILDPLLR